MEAYLYYLLEVIVGWPRLELFNVECSRGWLNQVTYM